MSNVSDVKSPNGGDQQTGHDSNQFTPIQPRKSTTQDMSDLYSPLFSQCTQENESVDVMWDWNSPHSKPRVRKHKRTDIQQSPKLPIKRQPSNNQITVFNKLKEELETLRDQIVEDAGAGNNGVSNAKPTNTKYNESVKNLEDIFNDSMEEQLIMCSQEAERNLYVNTKPVSKSQSLKDLDKTVPSQKCTIGKVSCSKDSVMKNNYVVSGETNCSSKNNSASKYCNDNLNKIADDSFDFILETLKDEDLEFNKPFTEVDKNEKVSSCSYVQNTEQFIEKTSNFSDSNANQSSEPTHSNYPNLSQPENHNFIGSDLPKCTAQEIEQKRKEALSKLQEKKKQTSFENESPIKCSPEEIEQKRLQAKAKLEAKKKQDIIERNRQQALKRLEESKRKRALQTQTSLPRKIHNANI